MFKRITLGILILLVIGVGGLGGFLYMRSHPSVAAIANAQTINGVDVVMSHDHLDARLYQTACASCHYNAASIFNADRPSLVENESITDEDPKQLITIILRGKGSEMPPFAHALKDTDVALIAAYLRSTRTANAAPWPGLESKVAAIRTTLIANAGQKKP
jgi:cytochrome c553